MKGFTLVILALFSAAPQATAQTETCEFGICAAADDECGVYLAPSTINGAGLGIFTSKPLEAGDKVGNGDIAIPIIDQIWHMGSNDYYTPFDDYIWQGWAVGMSTESVDKEATAVSTFWPGMDAAINCNLALINTGKATPQYDNGGLHRSKDPGAGAITPYHNGTTATTHRIPAGGELFKFYGDDWFNTRKEVFGELPLSDDWPKAQKLVEKFDKLSEHFTEDVKQDLWDMVAQWPMKGRIVKALPEKAKDIPLAAAEGIRILHQEQAMKSIKELEETGRCMDNIEPRQSNLPQAGRGGFATRSLSKGSIVTGSPILHIPFKEPFVNIYAAYTDDQGTWHKEEPLRVVGKQLLVNYCWSHPQSTLMLCPYGAGIGYVNHNKTLANIKMQWAPNGSVGQKDEWFEKDVETLESVYGTQLGMDFVALRDIQQGEELYFDYGQEWEDAWTEHVQNWEPVEGAEDYQPGYIINEMLADAPLRTWREQEEDPYPDNVELRCHSWTGHKNLKWNLEENGIECEIEARHVEADGTFLYDVVTANHETYKRVGRDTFHFKDIPYTRDHNQLNAFRHEIVIPDEIFPEKWKNAKG